MYQQSNQLPVDPHTPHQWAIIQGLPNAVPFMPPINTNPQLMPYAQQIVGNALLEATRQAGRNPLRTFYFNMLSTNNYQNQYFMELVQSVAELTDFLVGAKRKAILEAIQEAASVMNSVQAAMMLDKYPALRGMCTAEVVGGSAQWMQHFQGLAQEVMRYRQPAAVYQPTGQYHHGQPMMPNGLFSGGGHPQNPSFYQQPGMMTGTSPARNGNAFWGTPMGDTPSMGGSNGMHISGLSKAASREPIVREDITEISMLQDSPAPIIRSGQVTSFASPTKSAFDAVAVSTQPPPEPAVQEARPWDYIQTEDGSIVVPASLSQWKPSRKDDKPYRLAYNPKVHCLFHAQRPDGTIDEILVKWEVTETMDYLKNEIRSDMKNAQPIDPHAPRIDPNYDLLIHMSPVTDNMMAISAPPAPADPENTDVPELAPVVLTDVGFANNMGVLFMMGKLEADGVVEQLLEDPEADPDMVSCTENYTDVVKSVPCTEDDIAWMLRLSRSVNITEVLHGLEAAIGEVTPDILKEIAERLTDEVNIALKYHLQADTSIDDVREDYTPLLELLEQRYGDQGLKLWLDHESELVSRALNILTGDRLTQYWSLAYKPEQVERFVRKTMVFFDRVAVTYVNWNSTDMDVAFSDSGALSEATMPNLYRAVKAMFQRTEVSDVPFASHLMYLNDGVTLQFHKGWLGKDFFLISKF